MKNQSVVAVIFDETEQKLLVLKRRDIPIWVLPGGGVDEEETPEVAVLREVFEETGCHAEIRRKVAVYSPLNRLARETHLFECVCLPGMLQTGPETAQIGFFSLQDLPTPFFFVHQDWVNDTLVRKKGVIQKPLTKVTYWAFFKYFIRHPILVVRAILSRFGYPINSK